MGQIIEFPDIKKLKESIKELKKTLGDYVLERDNLILVVCENINAEYKLEFGSLEYSLYESYCKYLRLRRKKEMIQAKKNRQEKIILSDIELQLDREFVEYKKKLEKKISEINRALEHSKMESLSDEDEAEIKKLYRGIVKKLHPDLNPKMTDVERELFYHAAQAYENGNLNAIRIIFQIVDNGDMDEDFPSSIEELRKEEERLKTLVEQIQEEIDHIKTVPPYTLKKYLEDEKEKLEKIRELKQELVSFQDAIRTEEEYINELLQ